jgi:hypothetical protein
MQFLVAPSCVGTAKPYVLAILRFAVYNKIPGNLAVVSLLHINPGLGSIYKKRKDSPIVCEPKPSSVQSSLYSLVDYYAQNLVPELSL